MLISWPHLLECTRVPGARPRLPAFVFTLMLACGTAAGSDGLRVERPLEVAFSVAEMTEQARSMGFTDSGVATTLQENLTRAGLAGRRSDPERDSDVLFVDIIVEDETFYASLGFWRMASYRLPGGALNSEFVTVWQDYAVGAHHGDPATVNATVKRIIDRFIVRYSDVNGVSQPQRVAATQ